MHVVNDNSDLIESRTLSSIADRLTVTSDVERRNMVGLRADVDCPAARRAQALATALSNQKSTIVCPRCAPRAMISACLSTLSCVLIRINGRHAVGSITKTDSNAEIESTFLLVHATCMAMIGCPSTNKCHAIEPAYRQFASYEPHGLIASFRTTGGSPTASVQHSRHLAFILVAQRLRLALKDISTLLAGMLGQRTPATHDWQ